MDPRKALWLGGMSGVGKTTAARHVAQLYDLWLYSLDARTYAHAEAMRVPALGMSADELWLERTPEQMADDFETEARARFHLVLADLELIPDDGAPVLVEGPQLLPDVVGEPALFVVAQPEVQRRLLAGRGSLTFSRTRDPERAFANRFRRDELLAARLRSSGRAVEVSDGLETVALVERFVRTHAPEWTAAADHGDVAARRVDENERRLDQWRRYSSYESRAADAALTFACECGRRGCAEQVALSVRDAARTPRLAH